jgi:hypothetical protein
MIEMAAILRLLEHGDKPACVQWRRRAGMRIEQPARGRRFGA